MNTAPNEIRFFPIDQIALSPMNPRQNHDAVEIEALAMSIAVAGMIQPLACYLPSDEAPEAVDGGRRLAAWRHLRANGSGMADARDPSTD